MVKHKVKKIEKSAVELSVTVPADTLQAEYEKLIKKYCATVQIKGFRKGKAPRSVLEKKYGDSMKQESMFNAIDASYQEVLKEVEPKPLPYSTPKLKDEEKLEVEDGKDLTYTLVYDVYPEVEVPKSTGLTVEVPNVAIAKEDMDEELKKIQEQNSMVVEKAGKIAKDDIVTMNYQELDADKNPVEGTKREDFTFTVGTGYNVYDIDEDVIGLAKGDKKEITKTYADDYKIESYAGKTLTLQVEITQVKTKDVPPLDDELAQDVSEEFKTLDDLKKSIEERLEKTLEAGVQNYTHTKIMEQIVEGCSIEVPESMITMECENQWRRFAQQTGMPEEQLMQIMTAQGQTKEQMMASWKEPAEKSVRAQLVEMALIKEQKIEVSDEEIDAELKEVPLQEGQTFEEVKDFYKQNGYLEMVRNNLEARKLSQYLAKENKVKKGKKVSLAEFQAMEK